MKNDQKRADVATAQAGNPEHHEDYAGEMHAPPAAHAPLEPIDFPPLVSTLDLFAALIAAITLGPAGDSPHHLKNYRAKIDRLCTDGEEQIKRERAFSKAGLGVPSVVIWIESGAIHDMATTGPVDVTILDADVEGSDLENLHKIDGEEYRVTRQEPEIAANRVEVVLAQL